MSKKTRLVAGLGIAGVATEGLAPLMVTLGEGAVRFTFVATGSVFMMLAILWLASSPSTHRSPTNVLLRMTMCLLVAALVLGSAVGIGQGNPTAFLIGDALRLGLTVFAFFLAVRLTSADRTVFLRSTWLTFCTLEIVKALVVVMGLSNVENLRIGGGSAVALAMAIVWHPPLKGRQGRRVSALGVAAIVFNLMTALVRSLWLAAAIQLVLWGVNTVRLRPSRTVRRTAALAIIGATLLVLADAAEMNLTSRLTDRIELTAGDRDEDPSFLIREAENRASESALGASSIPWLGVGLGGTLQLDGVLIHHIHNTQRSLIFRNGLVGAALWWCLVAISVGSALSILLWRVRNPEAQMLLVACVGVLVTATFFYGLIGVLPASFVVARAGYLITHRRLRSSLPFETANISRSPELHS